MNREERVQILKKVKSEIYNIIVNTLRAVDDELDKETYKDENGITLIRGKNARMRLNSLRADVLQRIREVGISYEGESDE